MDVTRLLVRSDLRRRWRSWLTIVVLVGIIGGLSMAAVAGWRRTNSAMERFFEYHQAANGYTEGLFEKEAVEAIPGVEAAIGGDYFLLAPIDDAGQVHPEHLGQVSPFSTDSPERVHRLRPADPRGRGAARPVGGDGGRRRRGDGGALRPPGRRPPHHAGLRHGPGRAALREHRHAGAHRGALRLHGDRHHPLAAGRGAAPEGARRRLHGQRRGAPRAGLRCRAPRRRRPEPRCSVRRRRPGRSLAASSCGSTSPRRRPRRSTAAIEALDPEAFVDFSPSDAQRAAEEASRSIRLQATLLLALGAVVAIGGIVLITQALRRQLDADRDVQRSLRALGATRSSAVRAAAVKSALVAVASAAVAVARRHRRLPAHPGRPRPPRRDRSRDRRRPDRAGARGAGAGGARRGLRGRQRLARHRRRAAGPIVERRRAASAIGRRRQGCRLRWWRACGRRPSAPAGPRSSPRCSWRRSGSSAPSASRRASRSSPPTPPSGAGPSMRWSGMATTRLALERAEEKLAGQPDDRVVRGSDRAWTPSPSARSTRRSTPGRPPSSTSRARSSRACSRATRPQADDEIALGGATANQLGVGVGDEIQVDAGDEPRALHGDGDLGDAPRLRRGPHRRGRAAGAVGPGGHRRRPRAAAPAGGVRRRRRPR